MLLHKKCEIIFGAISNYSVIATLDFSMLLLQAFNCNSFRSSYLCLIFFDWFCKFVHVFFVLLSIDLNRSSNYYNITEKELMPVKARMSDNFNIATKKGSKELLPKMKRVKSDNYTRSKTEESNITIAILEKSPKIILHFGCTNIIFADSNLST